MRLTFTLQSAYTGSTYVAGPFNISGTTSSGTTYLLASGVTKSQLIAGHPVDTTYETLTGGTINSTGTCTTSRSWYIGTEPEPQPLGILMDNDLILGINETSTCPGTGIPSNVYVSEFDYNSRYLSSTPKFMTLYQDESLSTLYTGYNFVYVIGDSGEINEVYSISPTTAVIGNPASAQPC